VRLLIISQVPDRRVRKTRLSFNDRSGHSLRAWLAISREAFYDEARVAILGMAFCYPGRDGPDSIRRHLRAGIEAYRMCCSRRVPALPAVHQLSRVSLSPVPKIPYSSPPARSLRTGFLLPARSGKFTAVLDVPRSKILEKTM